jgi:hypothetical protein
MLNRLFVGLRGEFNFGIQGLLVPVISTVFISSGAFAENITCVDVGNGVKACSDRTTVVDVGNGVYVSSDRTTIVNVGNGVYVSSDGTTMVDVGGGVYAGSNGRTVIVVDSEGAPGSWDYSRDTTPDRPSSPSRPKETSNSTPSCAYYFMSDSALSWTFNEIGDTYQNACKKARTRCERAIELNRKNLIDFELACYAQGDQSNPAIQFKQAWVMCGASRQNYQECSIPNQSTGVKIKKAYGTVFGSFKTFSEVNDYYKSLGGTQANVIPMKREMVEHCGAEGKKWGITADRQRLWVKNDCRGAFYVNFSSDKGTPSTPAKQCNQAQLDNCLQFGGGNACYTKWCD